jgi:hypothetical protein
MDVFLLAPPLMRLRDDLLDVEGRYTSSNSARGVHLISKHSRRSGKQARSPLRASPPSQRKRPLHVRTRMCGQNTRPIGATQTDKVVRTRPRAPIPVSDLGPKCVGLDSSRVLSRPPCPPRAQPTEAPSHFPPPPLCFPAARAPPPFRRRRRHVHHRRPLAAPRPPKRSPSFHRTPTPP